MMSKVMMVVNEACLTFSSRHRAHTRSEGSWTRPQRARTGRRPFKQPSLCLNSFSSYNHHPHAHFLFNQASRRQSRRRAFSLSSAPKPWPPPHQSPRPSAADATVALLSPPTRRAHPGPTLRPTRRPPSSQLSLPLERRARVETFRCRRRIRAPSLVSSPSTPPPRAAATSRRAPPTSPHPRPTRAIRTLDPLPGLQLARPTPTPRRLASLGCKDLRHHPPRHHPRSHPSSAPLIGRRHLSPHQPSRSRSRRAPAAM